MPNALKEGRAAFLFVLPVGMALYFGFRHWAYDDPFITFRYSDNLSRGLGFVYNPGERVLSTTAPFYAVLLALFGQLWADLPRLSNLISGLSLALGSVFLHKLGRHWKTSVAGFVAAGLFPLFPLMVSTFGAETCFYVMLNLGAIAFYVAHEYDLAMVLAGLATLTRADGILVAMVLGVHFLIAERRIPWRPVVLFGIVVAPWYLFSWIYFGSPFPATLSAKQYQGQMAISQSFAQGFVGLIRNYGRHPTYWVHGVLALTGLGYAALKAREWLLVFAWGTLYFVSYSLLGVSRYLWYYAPLVPVILAATGLGAVAIKQWLPAWLVGGWRGVALLITLVGVLLWPQARGLRNLRRKPYERAGVYRDVGTWLSQNTPADASVGTLEVGMIGYYARRRVIDFAGLVQPSVARQMSWATTYEDTALWAIERYRPDYVALGDGWFPVVAEQLLADRCEPAKSFSDEVFPGTFTVHACRWQE